MTGNQEAEGLRTIHDRGQENIQDTERISYQPQATAHGPSIWKWAGTCAVLCVLGVIWRWPSFNYLNNYSFNSFGNLQYSDVLNFWLTRNLAAHQIPYIQQNVEYPVLTGVITWLTAYIPDIHGYFLANAALLSLCLIGCVLLLGRLQATSGLWRFALAPAIVLYVILNWDAIGLIALVAGLYCMRREHFIAAGVSLAIGASAKLFPGFVLPAFVIYAGYSGWDAPGQHFKSNVAGLLTRLSPAIHLLAGFAVVTLAINLPVALLSWRGWSYFITFQASRGINPDSIWAHIPGATEGFADTWYPRLFLLALAVILFELLRKRGAAWEAASLLIILDFLLFTKDYSPQYDLWILPLLTLLLCPFWLWLVYCIADGAYYAGIFWYYFASMGGHPPLITNAGNLLNYTVRGREVLLGLLFIWGYMRLRQALYLRDSDHRSPALS